MNKKSTLTLMLVSFMFLSAGEPTQATKQGDTTSPWLVQPPTDYEAAVAVVKDQLTALRTNDSSKAYYAYTSKGFRKAFSLEDFKNMIRRFKGFYQNRSFKAENAEFDGASVIKLTGKLLAADGESMSIKFDMVLEDGDWKVQNIQLYQRSARNRMQINASQAP